MMAIDENGNLWGCGNNSEGQLGDGTKADKRILVSIKDGTKFKEISAGIQYSLAIDIEGNLWTWGRNDYGLGNGENASSLVPIQLF